MSQQVTITLDDDVAERLKAKAHEIGTPTADAAAEAVRTWLASDTPVDKPFHVEARLLEAREGVSFECVWRLLAEDDVERFRQ